MTTLPEFFTTQHRLREKAVLDQGAGSSLFLVEDPSQDELLVEIYGPEHRGVLRQSGIVGQLQHSAIAPIVGTGTMNNGQEFFVRRSLPGEQLSKYTSSGIGAHHLSQEEALAVFAPLADATDFLIQQGRAGFALRALNPRRIILTDNRSNAFFASVGPATATDAPTASAKEVIDRLAQLVSAAYPGFRAAAAYPSAAAVIDAVRSTHADSPGPARPRGSQLRNTPPPRRRSGPGRSNPSNPSLAMLPIPRSHHPPRAPRNRRARSLRAWAWAFFSCS
ncbi:hypothetical protein [Corynebacterium hiratae]|uniref:hypothetical protein n=1 Tax=Corynebacterium hiratae TaxID=3139423 RepID=UPI00272E0C40|nr:hypothetical protein [Corynebacterium aurimucosum]